MVVCDFYGKVQIAGYAGQGESTVGNESAVRKWYLPPCCVP